MVIIQGPEACDDPKMSCMILVPYSPLILNVLCHTVRGNNSFAIFSTLQLLEFVSISDYLQTDTAEKITVMLQRMTAGFITCHREETRIVKWFCTHVPSLKCPKLNSLAR